VRVAETGIDYESKACEALMDGDAVAAQAWATLHQARMTADLARTVDEIKDVVAEIKGSVSGIASAG
jgi:hypothetical protein